jgi:hypothetical protein
MLRKCAVFFIWLSFFLLLSHNLIPHHHHISHGGELIEHNHGGHDDDDADEDGLSNYLHSDSGIEFLQGYEIVNNSATTYAILSSDSQIISTEGAPTIIEPPEDQCPAVSYKFFSDSGLRAPPSALFY